MSRDAARENVEAFIAGVEALRDPLAMATTRFAAHIEDERRVLAVPTERLLARLLEEAARLERFAAENAREREALVELAGQVETHKQSLDKALTEEQAASVDVQRATLEKASANEALDASEAIETIARGELAQALQDLGAFRMACRAPGSPPSGDEPPPCANEQVHDEALERRYSLIESLAKRQNAWLVAMELRVDRLETLAAADQQLAMHLAALAKASGEVLEHRTRFEAFSREHQRRYAALEAAEALRASLEGGRLANERAVRSWRDLLVEAIPSLSEAPHLH